jgi:hypothetical protein
MLLFLALFMQVQVRVTVPTVRFEVAPPMVVVQPGVQVVQDYDEEVFFVDGRYWMRGRDGRWYRANDYRGGWIVAEPRVVPAPIVRMPPGRYRHHRGKPEKFRVANGDGSVTEYKVKQKRGRTEVKVKEKGGGRKKGKWR